MRDILFLAHRLPWPPDRGDKIRSYHLLRHIASFARVHLVTFAEDEAEYRGAESLRPMLASLHIERRSHNRAMGVAKALLSGRAASVALFDSPTMRPAVSRLLREQDIGTIFAFSGQMAQFVPAARAARFVMDFVDVDSEKFRAYSGHGPMPLRLLYRREARLLAKFEREVAQTADTVMFVSEAEAALFRARGDCPPHKVIAIENGVDLESLAPDTNFLPLDAAIQGQGPFIVFTGQMDYPPNIEAAQIFANDSFPEILSRYPDARFAIVGRNPAPSLGKLNQPGVVVTGAVDDVRPWLAAATVVVAPLRIARGVQNKVLEAMAMARPVVASPAAAEGIDAEPGREIVVARQDEMSSAVLALLADPERAGQIASSARALMVRRYRWDACLRSLEAVLTP